MYFDQLQESFDMVCWDVIDCIMELLRFDSLFHEMVNVCVKKFLLLNTHRGISDGDVSGHLSTRVIN